MATPKYIEAKAIQLQKELNKVARLAEELEEWYAKQTDEYEAMDFFADCRLDNPYEYDLYATLDALEEVAS